MMSAFIVLTESCYGGRDAVKLFRKETDADTYAESIPELDAVVIVILLPDETDKVYVTLTEEFYGGEEIIEAFATSEEAEKYISNINKGGSLDVIVKELLLQ